MLQIAGPQQEIALLDLDLCVVGVPLGHCLLQLDAVGAQAARGLPVEVYHRGAYDIPIPTSRYDAVRVLMLVCAVTSAAFVEPAYGDLYGIEETHDLPVEMIHMLLQFCPELRICCQNLVGFAVPVQFSSLHGLCPQQILPRFGIHMISAQELGEQSYQFLHSLYLRRGQGNDDKY